MKKLIAYVFLCTMHAGYSTSSWFDFSSEKIINNSKTKGYYNSFIKISLSICNPIGFCVSKLTNELVNFSSLANAGFGFQDTIEEKRNTPPIDKKPIPLHIQIQKRGRKLKTIKQYQENALKQRIESLNSIIESTPKTTNQNNAVTLALIKTARKGVTKKNFNMITKKELKKYHATIREIETTYLDQIK